MLKIVLHALVNVIVACLNLLLLPFTWPLWLMYMGTPRVVDLE